MWVKLIDGFMDINNKTTRQNRPLRDTQFAWRRRQTRCKVVRRERQRQLKCCKLCWIWMLRRCFVWIVWPTFVSWLVILGNWVCELTTTTTTVAAKVQVASGIKELWNTQSWNENTTNIILCMLDYALFSVMSWNTFNIEDNLRNYWGSDLNKFSSLTCNEWILKFWLKIAHNNC